MKQLDFKINDAFPTVPATLRAVTEALHTLGANIVEIRNLVRGDDGTPVAKATLFELSGESTMKLAEDLEGRLDSGSSLGRWWDVSDNLPHAGYAGRTRTPSTAKALREIYRGFASAAENIAATPGFTVKVFVYPAGTREEDDAVLAEVSLKGTHTFTFGQARELWFDPAITRIWQQN